MSDTFYPGGREPQQFRASSRSAPKPRSSPTAKIVDQLSPDARNAIFGRLSEASARIVDAARGPSGMARAGGAVSGIGRFVGRANDMVEQGIRANPYGGYIGDDERTDRYTGFEGYFGESEFQGPDGSVRFYPGDARKILDTMAPETVARVQERLKALGFISGNYASGAVLPETVTAFSDLLSESNRRGMTWGSTLGELEKLYDELGIDAEDGGAAGPAPFISEAYLAPDYATLAQGVKEKLRSELGRDPDESEMALLTAELSGWDRDAYEVEESARRAEYDAAVAAGESGAEEGTPEGSWRTVDPTARFKESFESKFSAELAGLERNEEVAESQELTTGAVSTLSRMAGGMG